LVFLQNRFQNQPEVYKQFLEILQTYQRESKPIQDVYAQVTQLFNGAPDLLQDFKQFLPESAAQAKAAAAEEAAIQQSNVRGTADYISNMPGIRSNTPQQTKLPPMGNFAPPSVSKDNKKRRGGAGAQVTMSDLRSGMPEASAQGNRNMSQAVNTNKVSLRIYISSYPLANSE
jgi:paired amphipathic helix protein Sin3a